MKRSLFNSTLGTHYVLGYVNTALNWKDRVVSLMCSSSKDGVIDKSAFTMYLIKYHDFIVLHWKSPNLIKGKN